MAGDAARAASALIQQELGTLEVADQVFCELALKAAMDVGGVASVGRAAGLFRRKATGDAVQVERGEGEVAFSISLSARYDVRIPDMVEELRQRVKAVVEATTGYKVRAINITVEHVVPPEAQRERHKAPARPPQLPKTPPIPDQQ